MESKDRQGLLTVAELATWLNISRPQVYRLLNEAGLPAVRLRDGGDLRFDLRDVEEWLKSRKVAMVG